MSDKIPYASPDRVEVPTLIASGSTPMGEALERAIDRVAARKRRYKEAGVQYYRPWLLLITDGAPTDDWQSAAQSVRAGEAAGGRAPATGPTPPTSPAASTTA